MGQITQNTSNQSNHEWFIDWFDSPFYHILYQNRDFKEAQFFIDQLTHFLEFKTEHKILDLACGRGRHAIYLNQKGLNVLGLDLSARNIKYAKQFENQRLRFFVHDMRLVFDECCFDFVTNLFTSFGYFETDQEDIQVIQASTQYLKSKGKLIIDFLNPEKIIRHIRPYEVKIVQGIEFHIHKVYQDGFILKTIDFEYEKLSYHYVEKVKLINFEKFQHYFNQADLNLLHTFGNYALESYQAENSDRMIFVLEKK